MDSQLYKTWETLPSPYQTQQQDRTAGFQGRQTTPLRWLSPFETATLFGNASQTEAVRGAMSAAADTETSVRKGITAAKTWLPSMMSTLRRYFAVSHSSVSRKLLALFIPPLGYGYLWKFHSRFSGSGYLKHQKSLVTSSADVIDDSDQQAYDIEHLGPDLYLPLMSLTSYILLCGVTKGTFDNFHPEILPATASYSAGVLLIECLITAGALYLIGVPYIPFLDILCILSLKFQSLVVILFVGLMALPHWSLLAWISCVYCTLCTIHATFQSLFEAEDANRPQPEWGSNKTAPHKFIYLSVAISFIQIFFCWFLTPSFISKHLYATLAKKNN